MTVRDGDRVSTLFTRGRLFKLYDVITEQDTCVARVEAMECPAAAAASEFGPDSVPPFPAFWTPDKVLVRFFYFLSSTVYKFPPNHKAEIAKKLILILAHFKIIELLKNIFFKNKLLGD